VIHFSSKMVKDIDLLGINQYTTGRLEFVHPMPQHINKALCTKIMCTNIPNIRIYLTINTITFEVHGDPCSLCKENNESFNLIVQTTLLQHIILKITSSLRATAGSVAVSLRVRRLLLCKKSSNFCTILYFRT
jgi:hypothetical protein